MINEKRGPVGLLLVIKERNWFTIIGRRISEEGKEYGGYLLNH